MILWLKKSRISSQLTQEKVNKVVAMGWTIMGSAKDGGRERLAQNTSRFEIKMKVSITKRTNSIGYGISLNYSML